MKSNFNNPVPLSEVPAGGVGLVCDPPRGAEIPRRLRDLGFVPGTRLVIRRRAPLGDPVEVEIRGYRLCLRTEELRDVCLEVESSAGGARS